MIKGKTKDFIVGFTDLGNCDDFFTEMLEWRLGLTDVIEYAGDLMSPPNNPTDKSKPTFLNKPKSKSIRAGRYNDTDSDESD